MEIATLAICFICLILQTIGLLRKPKWPKAVNIERMIREIHQSSRATGGRVHIHEIERIAREHEKQSAEESAK